MGILAFVIGPSGSGKTTSLENIPPKNIFIFNCDKKHLPFPAAGETYSEKAKNYLRTSDAATIKEALRNISTQAPHIRVAVIDTINGIMTDKEMAERKKKEFDKWMDLAAEIYELSNFINDELRPDLIVYMMIHEDTIRDDSGAVVERKAKTNGRKLEKIVLESKASIVLFTEIQNTENGLEYFFITKSNGTSSAKTPKGMYEESKIPNDLFAVTKRISSYYFPKKEKVAEPVKK